MCSGLRDALQYLIMLLVGRRADFKVFWPACYAYFDVVSRLWQPIP